MSNAQLDMAPFYFIWPLLIDYIVEYIFADQLTLFDMTDEISQNLATLQVLSTIFYAIIGQYVVAHYIKGEWFCQSTLTPYVDCNSIMMLMKFSDLSQSDRSNWVMWQVKDPCPRPG